jgi:radial spoke head protein 9
MESRTLNQDLVNVASSGAVLSVEQKAALMHSLVQIKAQQKFCKVIFLGKILGTGNDYFLVQGVGEDELKERKTLFSVDCIKWGLMPTPDDETRRRAAMIKGRFTGDPSHIFEAESKASEDGGEADQITVKEEDRLALVVEKLCHDVVIVPRGAYKRDMDGLVQPNRMFEGLSPTEATRFTSYLHFREPELLNTKSLLEKADLDPALDFLDPIDSDIPAGGAWSMQQENGGQLIVFRSLHWLGFTFFHTPLTKSYGYIYVGTGEKNLDLPFML